MKCYRPIRLKTGQLVRCGHCLACQASKTDDNIKRFNSETKEYGCYFCTFTYADEFLPSYGVDKQDVVIFKNKLKKKYNFKYVFIGEYGGRYNRPHYHGLLWFIDEKPTFAEIEALWKFGNVSIEEVDDKQCNYVAKYHATKVLSEDVYVAPKQKYYFKYEFETNSPLHEEADDIDDYLNNLQVSKVIVDEYKNMTVESFRKLNPVKANEPFRLCSKGIGVSMLKDPLIEESVKSGRYYYVDGQGVKNSLPRYVMDKLTPLDRAKQKIAMLKYRQHKALHPYEDKRYVTAMLKYRGMSEEDAWNKYNMVEYDKWYKKYYENVIRKKKHESPL